MIRNIRFCGMVVLCLAWTFNPATAEEKKPPAATNAASQSKAAFEAKFNDYKAAIRDIEKLQGEFQTADDAEREKLNATLAAQVAHAQSLVNAMVDAAEADYRFAPNSDPQVTKLLASVAKYYTIGRQVGPGRSSPRNPEDVFYPVDGGDQYERALPIVKLLIDGGAKDNELYVWGFLCAYMTNDFDLAKTYLAKVKETNAMEGIMRATESGNEDPQAGVMKNVMHAMSTCIAKFDEQRELWAKESAIRAAEAKADDLPRVKLITTKGEITLELFENEAPETVANFLTLVKQGYYNGSPFHRVLPGFMAQGGAKSDDGNGGPGYTIHDECFRPDYRRHFRGTLSMAHSSQRDSGSSQFFLTFVPTMSLNGLYTAFGRVIDGMEVLGDLQRRSPEHQNNAPKADRILKAEVLRDRGHEYKFEKLAE